MMYRKYFVYIDDGKDVFKVAIAAESEKQAEDYCIGNGTVIAVKDVTDDYTIDIAKIHDALEQAGFGKYEMDFICRELQIAESRFAV